MTYKLILVCNNKLSVWSFADLIASLCPVSVPNNYDILYINLQEPALLHITSWKNSSKLFTYFFLSTVMVVLLFWAHNWLINELNTWLKSNNIPYKPKRKNQIKPSILKLCFPFFNASCPNLKILSQVSIILFHLCHPELYVLVDKNYIPLTKFLKKELKP